MVDIVTPVPITTTVKKSTLNDFICILIISLCRKCKKKKKSVEFFFNCYCRTFVFFLNCEKRSRFACSKNCMHAHDFQLNCFFYASCSLSYVIGLLCSFAVLFLLQHHGKILLLGTGCSFEATLSSSVSSLHFMRYPISLSLTKHCK